MGPVHLVSHSDYQVLLPKPSSYSAAKDLTAQYNGFIRYDAANSLKKGIAQDKYILVKSMENVIDTNVDKKYQSRLNEDLKKWIKEESKTDKPEFDIEEKVENISNNLDNIDVHNNLNLEKIDVTGIIYDGTTYVRVRDFEKLGYAVNYEENEWGDKIATIIKN